MVLWYFKRYFNETYLPSLEQPDTCTVYANWELPFKLPYFL